MLTTWLTSRFWVFNSCHFFLISRLSLVSFPTLSSQAPQSIPSNPLLPRQLTSLFFWTVICWTHSGSIQPLVSPLYTWMSGEKKKSPDYQKLMSVIDISGDISLFVIINVEEMMELEKNHFLAISIVTTQARGINGCYYKRVKVEWGTFYTVSKCLPRIVIIKGWRSNFFLEKPGRYHLKQLIKLMSSEMGQIDIVGYLLGYNKKNPTSLLWCSTMIWVWL